MFFKRQLPVIIMVSIGILTLLAHFIKIDSIGTWVEEDSLLWFDIIAAFAIFLGAFNLLKIHFSKIVKKKDDFQYSIILILGFCLMIFAGFLYRGSGNQKNWGDHIKDPDSLFTWMFDSLFYPLDATMFALLAFFVASASYRAFKIRNFEATLLLISGVLLMLGRVPIGALIPWWAVVIMYVSLVFAIFASKIKDKKIFFISYLIINIFIIALIPFAINSLGIDLYTFLSIPLIQEWIFSIPATAGARAIMIGIALGTIAQSFRIITGRERSILGD